MTTSSSGVGPAGDLAATEFANKTFTAALGAMETLTLYVGERLGWLDALASGPLTATELAERTRTAERYAVEWLEMQAVYGNLTVVDHGTGAREQRRFGLAPDASEVVMDEAVLTTSPPRATWWSRRCTASARSSACPTACPLRHRWQPGRDAPVHFV